MEGDRDHALARRVRLPTDCTCPAYIDAGLKAIDPAAVLLYIGHGRWWLGVVKDASEDMGLPFRQADGLKALKLEYAKEAPNYWRMVRAMLKMEGFQYIAQFAGEPTWRIVLDFAERDYNYRTRFREVEAGIEHEMSGRAGEERIAKAGADAGRYLAREAYRSKVLRPRHVGAGLS